MFVLSRSYFCMVYYKLLTWDHMSLFYIIFFSILSYLFILYFYDLLQWILTLPLVSYLNFVLISLTLGPFLIHSEFLHQYIYPLIHAWLIFISHLLCNSLLLRFSFQLFFFYSHYLQLDTFFNHLSFRFSLSYFS